MISFRYIVQRTLLKALRESFLLTRNSLAGYRILPDATTVWCTEPEEHGYMLTPVFKCKTNPRLATTHRWNETEVLHNPTNSPKPLGMSTTPSSSPALIQPA